MTDTRFDVLGVGNAIVDVLASVDDAFIEQHGLAKDAMLLIDEERAEALYEAFPPAQGNLRRLRGELPGGRSEPRRARRLYWQGRR